MKEKLDICFFRIRKLTMRACGLLIAGLLLASHSSAQKLEWSRAFGSSGYGDALGIAVDAGGVYVTGRVEGALPGQTAGFHLDAYVRKYDFAGHEIWTRQFEFAERSVDEAFSIVVDADGVTVAGRYECVPDASSVCKSEGAFASRFDLSGTLLWTLPVEGLYQAWAIAAHADALFVAGDVHVFDPANTRRDSRPMVAKLDRAGNQLWTYEPAGDGSFSGIVVDESGVYVIGGTGAADIQKLDLDGHPVATMGDGTLHAKAIAADAGGLYVVGSGLRKYAHTGELLWGRALRFIPDNLVTHPGGVLVVAASSPGSPATQFFYQFTADGAFVRRNYFGTLTRQNYRLQNSAMYDDLLFVAGPVYGSTPDESQSFVARFSPTHPPQLVTIDLTSDSPALGVVHEYGQVQVRDLNGALLNRFIFTGIGGIVDVEVLPDLNGNGSRELAASGSAIGGRELQVVGPAGIEIRDLGTGDALTTAGLETRVTPRDLEIVDDWSGNSFPELASLGHGPAQAEVIDSNTGLPVKTVSFSKYLIPEDLDVFPDFNANGAPELAVLGENRSSDKSDKIEIRDLATGNIVQDIWLGAGWRVLEQQLFAGRNRPGSNELAVLKWRNDGARVVVEMRDVESRQSVDVMFFAGNFTPLKLLRIADVNGNGADEVAVFSMRPDSGRQKVQIRDTRSREFLRGVVFDKRLEYQDITTCQDINGNGSDELVFLGRRASDASLNVIVKDSGTGEQIAFLRF